MSEKHDKAGTLPDYISTDQNTRRVDGVVLVATDGRCSQCYLFQECSNYVHDPDARCEKSYRIDGTDKIWQKRQELPTTPEEQAEAEQGRAAVALIGRLIRELHPLPDLPADLLAGLRAVADWRGSK